MISNADLFNNLLKESLAEDNVVIEESQDEFCLITGEKLTDKYVTLSCNHKFNYDALTNEMIQWKSNYKNKYYCSKNKINFKTQTICPYCRTVTSGLIPWFHEVNGINYAKKTNINWPKKLWIMPNNCKYIFASGKKKGLKCDKGCFGLFCSGHEKHSHKYDNKGNLKNISKPSNVQIQNCFKCSHILLRGKRKGQSCNKKAKCYKKNGTTQEYYYCSLHVKKYNDPEPLVKV